MSGYWNGERAASRHVGGRVVSALPSHAYEANDDWEGLESFTDDLPGWEGLDPLGEDDPDQGGCIRCGRDPQGHREPFGGNPCCPSCAMWIITGGEDDRPFVRGANPDPVCDGCGLPVLEEPHTPADKTFHPECCPDPECPENEQ